MTVQAGMAAQAGGARGVAVALAGVVGLADLLFWEGRIGLSLVAFAAALVAVVAVRQPQAGPWPLLFLAGVLPVVEHVQALSLAFLAAGTVGAIAVLRVPAGGWPARASAAVRLLARLPLGGFAAGPVLARGLWPPQDERTGLRGVVQAWGLPLGGSMVLVALMADANPLIARAFSADIDWPDLAVRGMFWCGIGLVCLPLIDRAPLPSSLPGPRFATAAELPGLNAASVLRALLMFNAVVAVQTGLDLSVLVGGADLPPGMTPATYAHRGAYPLLAAALLAGAFALLAQPYLATHPLIRPLLLLWLTQNVVLCLSAMLRLDLYVAVFGLTYLRVWAMIWMALVAAGLALTGWQVARGQTRRWLVLRCAVMGVAVLYACCFVNFAHIIAAQNLTRSNPDVAYLCSLGPTAAGAFAPAGSDLRDLPSAAPRPCGTAGLFNAGWRDWEFRSWRVRRYISTERGPAG